MMPQNQSDAKQAASKPKKTEQEEQEERDEGLDQTLADSFPASDPPSSIPDPEDDQNVA